MKLPGKVVWITGASSGIGEALAFAMNRAGAHLILSGRNPETLTRVQQNCDNAKGQTIILPFDLARLENFPAIVEQAHACFGHLDILVNNGGIGQHSPALETHLDVDQAVMRVNYFAPVALTKAVLPAMQARKVGHIVVVSSLAGKIATPNRAAYSASKHALHGFFDALRAEVWRDGIKITLICPGFVRTNFRANALDAKGTPRGQKASAYKLALSADACAAEMLKAIVREKEEVYIGWQKFALYAARLFPSLVSQIVRRTKIF